MRVSESNIPYELENLFVLDVGNFFFFKGFIISEIKEGILFNWDSAQEIIKLAYEHYGEKPNITYVSNRIHSYSVVPQDWLKFFAARHILKGMAVVTYSKASTSNVIFEKIFFSSKIKKFTDLIEAVDWAASLSED